MIYIIGIRQNNIVVLVVIKKLFLCFKKIRRNQNVRKLFMIFFKQTYNNIDTQSEYKKTFREKTKLLHLGTKTSADFDSH